MTCYFIKSKDEAINRSTAEYTRELIVNHVSGRLKVAPEHTSDRVLSVMRKPSFEQFETFKRIFDRINREENLRQQLIPYFISSHPGCKEEDMAELAVITKTSGLPPGTSAGLHSHSDDGCYRSLVYRIPSIHVRTDIQC